MAAVFNDILITHDGKQYTIKPTFELMRKIEQPVSHGGLGVSLARLAGRASSGDVPLTEIACVLAFMLRTQEVTVADEDMFVAVMQSDNIQEVISMVTTAFFPVIKPDEKPVSPGKKK